MAQRAPPPGKEYVGFSMYVGASVTVVAYFVWATAPKSWLEAIGAHYYPSRYWAVAVPAFLLMSMLYIYIALSCYNLGILEYPPDALETITDLDARICDEPLFAPSDATIDLPLSLINDILYD